LDSCTHYDLDLPVGLIRVMHNKTRTQTRLLCLHGWLDNRASFIPMLPYMQAVECVVVDMVGHGRSAHRDRASLYHYIDYVRDIKLIMDALQWEHCHLLGHSMGGSIALMAANAFSDHIQSLIMVDALHPLSRHPKDGPTMLHRSLEQFARWNPNRSKTFPDIDKAVKTRLKASPYLHSEASARLIMEYATKKTKQGYTLLSDARLNFRSALMLSREQVEAFIQAVKQPVLAILATRGIVQNRQDIDQTLGLFQNINVNYIDGGHHVHMEKPQQVAEKCLQFLSVSMEN
jgi:pimeloyl-ACP methyl ester carboxylesterase